GCGGVVAAPAGAPPSLALVDALHEAGGNPLLTLGLLQSFIDAGALVVRDGALDLDGSAPASSPHDLREIVSSLLAKVDDDVKRSLVRVALLGEGVALDTVRAATDWSRDELLDVLDEGEEHGILRVDAARVVFAHDLLRWSLVQSVSGVARRRMHRELAEHLEAGTDPGDEARVEILADQLRLAGDR